MAKKYVNLDALIVREDFAVTNDNPAQTGGKVADFTLPELIEGRSMFNLLRKPYFQRETSNWTPQQVKDLVTNFVDEELIPAVILWKAADKSIFVIDGAHRLSALVAWVNDDYGDKTISQRFFGLENISKGQIAAANEARKLIEDEIGSYADLQKIMTNPSGIDPIKVKRAKSSGGFAVTVQFVPNDSDHAETSFYKINQGGAVIDDTEKEIIQARKRPEALAARALLRAGSGHKFWSAFKPEVGQEIEKLAKESYSLLYEPESSDTYRTLDLAMAGAGYSSNTLEVLYEFVHLANDLARVRQSAKQALEPLPKDDPRNDKDGSATVAYLKKIRDLAKVICSDSKESLGLHPAVYSYTATGKFQPTAFFAQVILVKKLEKADGFYQFTDQRERFENFLVTYKYFINQLVSGRGSMTRSLGPLLKMYEMILDGIKGARSDEDIKNELLAHPDYSDLSVASPTDKKRGKNFSTPTKAAVRLRDALAAAQTCPECRARIHNFANVIDHNVPKSKGGGGSSENGGVLHPYCDSGHKNKRLHLEAKKS